MWRGTVRTMESRSGEQWAKMEFGDIRCRFWHQNGGTQQRGALGTIEPFCRASTGEGCYGGLLFALACYASRVKVDKKGCKVKMKPMCQALGMLCATFLPLCWVLCPTSVAVPEMSTDVQSWSERQWKFSKGMIEGQAETSSWGLLN